MVWSGNDIMYTRPLLPTCFLNLSQGHTNRQTDSLPFVSYVLLTTIGHGTHIRHSILDFLLR